MESNVCQFGAYDPTAKCDKRAGYAIQDFDEVTSVDFDGSELVVCYAHLGAAIYRECTKFKDASVRVYII